MKGRTTLIFFGVLILIAAYIYIYEIKGKVRKEKAQEKAKKLLVFDNKDIQKLTVKRASDSFSCQKNKEEDWRFLFPVDDRADKSTLSSLVTSLTDLKADREDHDVQTFSDFGLEPPLYTVIVGSSDGKNDTLFLGEKNPTGSYLYARKPQEKRLILTSNSVETYLTKSIFDLRDKSVLTFEKDNVERIKIETPGKSIVLAKNVSVWNLTAPIASRADENAVDTFLNQFKWAQSKEYVEENPKSLDRYGLSHPLMSLTLTLGANKSQSVLWVGRQKDKDRYYAKDTARFPVFVVDTNLVREFKKTVFDFRDKKIVRFETDSVQSVMVEYSNKPSLICQKDATGNWAIESPKKAKAVSYKINNILYDLRDMKALDFLSAKTTDLGLYGLDRPQTRTIFKDKKGNSLVDVSAGREAGKDQVYVMDVKAKSVFKVNSTFLKNMNPPIDDIVEKEKVKKEPEKKSEKVPVAKRTKSKK